MPEAKKKAEKTTFQFINISNAEESRSEDVLWKVRSHIAKNHVYVNTSRRQPRKLKRDRLVAQAQAASGDSSETSSNESRDARLSSSLIKAHDGRTGIIPLCKHPACRDSAPHLVTACEMRHYLNSSNIKLIERLRPNASLDPFNAIPCEATAHNHRAILAAHEMVQTRFASYATWLHRSLADRALLSTLILCIMTSVSMNQTHPDYPMEVMLSQKSKALSQLNRLLTDTRRNATDDVVYMIITMAEHEVSLKDPWTFSWHVEGLRRIMELRSRQGEEAIGPMLARAAGWVIAIHVHFLGVDGMYSMPASPSSSGSQSSSPSSSSAQSLSTQLARSRRSTPSSLLDTKVCPAQRLLSAIKGTIFIMNSVLKHCSKDFRSVWRLMIDLEDVVDACHAAKPDITKDKAARDFYLRLVEDRNQFDRDMHLLAKSDPEAYLFSPKEILVLERQNRLFADTPTIPLAVFECAKIGIECVIAALEDLFQTGKVHTVIHFDKAQALQWLEQKYFEELTGFPFKLVKHFAQYAAGFTSLDWYD